MIGGLVFHYQWQVIGGYANMNVCLVIGKVRKWKHAVYTFKGIDVPSHSMSKQLIALYIHEKTGINEMGGL